MPRNIKKLLENTILRTSAPCRVDMGGTLDIKTVYLPMQHLQPATFNLAIDLRTEISLLPYGGDKIKVSSRGFESAEFDPGEAPYHHPLGLMFAVADYFNVSGLHIRIDSSSPPRSALGGSSAAAVALVCALASLHVDGPLSRRRIALIAHAIEEAAARIPCGIQDQLAAVYGGANAWYWRSPSGCPDFQRTIVIDGKGCEQFNDRFIVAYCGNPHESKDINGRWMDHFIRAGDRSLWREIIACSRSFIDAMTSGRINDAAAAMNRDGSLRKQMTPDVFDDMGESLAAAAGETECGARFTGAGGGGCVWAIGEPENIGRLKKRWAAIVEVREDACLLKTGIDTRGLAVPEGIDITD